MKKQTLVFLPLYPLHVYVIVCNPVYIYIYVCDRQNPGISSLFLPARATALIGRATPGDRWLDRKELLLTAFPLLNDSSRTFQQVTTCNL